MHQPHVAHLVPPRRLRARRPGAGHRPALAHLDLRPGVDRGRPLARLCAAPHARHVESQRHGRVSARVRAERGRKARRGALRRERPQADGRGARGPHLEPLVLGQLPRGGRNQARPAARRGARAIHRGHGRRSARRPWRAGRRRVRGLRQVQGATRVLRSGARHDARRRARRHAVRGHCPGRRGSDWAAQRAGLGPGLRGRQRGAGHDHLHSICCGTPQGAGQGRDGQVDTSTRRSVRRA
mmetsp:Transcript_6918/g.19455  ORF Transcript_6918/g.19455 Transcript_6918/m.19455 type:complete len:240 (+) Transcript_6918:472-1191(+)